MPKLLERADNQDNGREFLRTIIHFYSATFDLLNGDLPDSEWLSQLGDFADCDNVGCIWWPAGQPEKYRDAFVSRNFEVPLDWLSSVDIFLNRHDRQEAVFLDDLSQNVQDEAPESAMPVYGSEKLIACLDWHPARVIIVFVRNKSSGGSWDDADRALLRELLPTLRKSVMVKKSLSYFRDQLDLANKVFDCFPRAMFSLLPTREALGCNRIARAFMEDGALLKLVDGRIEFTDPVLQGEFEEQLMVVRSFPQGRINEYGWYKSLPRPNGGNPLVLSMQALAHDNWRIESSPEECAVVITIGGDDFSVLPGESKLRDLYGMTPAQARFTNELFRSGSIEDASRSLHISINTGRSHVREIYSKVGVDNLAQLFRVISQNITSYAHSDD